MDWRLYTEHALAYFGALILVSTPLAEALEAAAARFEAHALSTPTPHDDEIASKVTRVTIKIAAGLRFLSALLPVLRIRGMLR
jgi:hypothetical protein